MPAKSKLKPKSKVKPTVKSPEKSKAAPKKPAKVASKTRSRGKVVARKPATSKGQYNPNTGKYDWALPEDGGWRELILHIIQKRINRDEFTLQDVYAAKQDLKERYPTARTIEATIRLWQIQT